MRVVKVKFLSQEKEAWVPAGSSIFQAAAAAGVQVEGSCGGKGACGKCRVKILSGGSGEPLSTEKEHLSGKDLAGGWALACQRPAEDGMIVDVEYLKDTQQRKSDLGSPDVVTAADPSAEKFFIAMDPPIIEDQTPDLERLLGRLPRDNVKAGPGVLSALPGVLRKAGFKVTAALVDNRLVAVEPGDTTRRKFGLAFDIGTTTLAGYLLDLNNGKTLAVSSLTNPQKVYGSDVISRINHASSGAAGLKQLQELVLGGVNEIVCSLLGENRVEENEVYEAVVVGNTTMSHIFFGIDPTYLAPAPFIPAFRQSIETRAGDLGLRINPAGRVLALPNIAGYVGSDTVGVMLATGMDRPEGISLAVDIGTNGEVVLSGRGRIVTCSTAAGPAFEGSHIRHGMRAAQGAIESVTLNGDVSLKVIGDADPRGICGSGLIDAAAEMLKAGIIDRTGRFANPEAPEWPMPPRLSSRLRKGDNGSEFVLVPGSGASTGDDIVITQKDIRELQLAKGAILAGIRVLLNEVGVTAADIDEVLLAGAFGNYIRKESALAIGLLPPVSVQRIIPVGNAAGKGAVLALVSRTERSRADYLSLSAEHVELSSRRDFQEEFVNALHFPEKAVD